MKTVIMTNKTGSVSVIAPVTKIEEYKSKGYVVLEEVKGGKK